MKKTDIIETIQGEGFEPKRKGRSFWMSCPFHTDKTPSLKIDSERQTFFCFSCNEGGDVIFFIRKLHNLTFKEAIAYLGLVRDQLVKVNPQEQTKRDLVKAFRAWERKYYQRLTRYYRNFHDLKRNFKTMDDVVQFSEIFDQMPLVEYHMDILTCGSDLRSVVNSGHQIFHAASRFS
jgi:DNA primase